MFGWLFVQYREKGKLHFGSKWLNLLGRTFIGSPESFGLQDCRENVLKSFYYLRADRKMPVADDGEHEAWKTDSLRASQVRHASEKYVSKAGFVVTATACMALCFGAMVVLKAKGITQSTSLPSLSAPALTMQECEQKSVKGQLTGNERSACIELYKNGGNR